MTQYKVLQDPRPDNQNYKLLNLETNQEETWERNTIIRRFPIGTILEIVNNEVIKL